MKHKNLSMILVFISVILTIGIGITMSILRNKPLSENEMNQDVLKEESAEEVVIEKIEHEHKNLVSPYENRRVITMKEGFYKTVKFETKYLYDRYNRIYVCETSAETNVQTYDFYNFPYCLKMITIPIDLQISEELIPQVSRYLMKQKIWNQHFTYNYDEKGKLESVIARPDLRIKYTYDELGRLLSVSVTEDEEDSYTFSYTYEEENKNAQGVYLNDIKIASLSYYEDTGKLHYMDTYKNSFCFGDIFYDIQSERFEFTYFDDGMVKSVEHRDGKEYLGVSFEKHDGKIEKAIVTEERNKKKYYTYTYDHDVISGYEFKGYDENYDLALLLAVQYEYDGH